MSGLNYVSETGDILQFAEDSPELKIEIFPAGDKSGLHIQNDPNDPFERESLIQRQGRVRIGCEHKGIVHGYYSNTCRDPYSLIIVEFRFDPNGIAARIKEAHATIKFASWEEGRRDPEVVNMYPQGMLFVQPTQQHEQTVRSGGVNLGGGAMGAEVGGELQSSKTIDRDTTDYTTVRGSIDLLRSYGPKNAVSWGFFENPTAKTGVVPSLRGAILVKRRDFQPFKASVTIKATADTHSRISAIFQKDPKDADVLYDPTRGGWKDLAQHSENLGAVDLKSFCDVTFRTLVTNTIKQC